MWRVQVQNRKEDLEGGGGTDTDEGISNDRNSEGKGERTGNWKMKFWGDAVSSRCVRGHSYCGLCCSPGIIDGECLQDRYESNRGDMRSREMLHFYLEFICRRPVI